MPARLTGRVASSIIHCTRHLLGVNCPISLLLLQYCVGSNRPVVLVGHSLGGLVLKKVCVQAAIEAAYNGVHKEACRAFCDNLAGVFFYATPHGGAPLAASADLIFRWLGKAGPVLDYLKVLSKAAVKLDTDFANYFPASSLPRTAVCESKPYKPVSVF